jgi:hypothetical protein
VRVGALERLCRQAREVVVRTSLYSVRARVSVTSRGFFCFCFFLLLLLGAASLSLLLSLLLFCLGVVVLE